MNMFDNTIKRATFEVAISRLPSPPNILLMKANQFWTKSNELSGKLIMGTQMLVFFSSIKEVEDSTKLFK
jgi:hypothetical protein